MSRYIDPVYDRAQSDIIGKTSKGHMNVADYLRIKNNTEIVNALIEYLLGITIDQNSIVDATITTKPPATYINDYAENIENIRQACHFPATIGVVELFFEWTGGVSGRTPNYEDINDWERDLALIFNNIAGAVDYQVYCGVSVCGQERFWQNRFRRFDWVEPVESPTRKPKTGVAVCGTGTTRQNMFREYS
jgi:hypothetical protein